MRVEDQVALELEMQGNIVIRTYRRGCPDLIAFPASLAASVLAVEVKGPGDIPRKEQKTTLEVLKKAGVQAYFKYTEEQAGKKKRERSPSLTPEERKQQEEFWIRAGREAFQRGQTEDQWPRHPNRGSAAYHLQRANWKYGWYQAFKDSRAMDSYHA